MTPLAALNPEENGMGRQLTMIAHRGGVVDGQRAENSRLGLDEAARRGYTGVELDVRLTIDGALLAHHDPHFGKIFGQPERLVAETTAAEARALEGVPGGEGCQLWAEVCAAAASASLSVMVDCKVRDPSDAILDEVAAVLAAEGLLKGALVLSDIARVGEYFDQTPARTALRAHTLRELLSPPSTENDTRILAANHFLFDHGNVLTAAVKRKQSAVACGLWVKIACDCNNYRTSSQRRLSAWT